MYSKNAKNEPQAEQRLLALGHPPAAHLPVVPALFRAAGPKAWERLLDFLVSSIRNKNTREAYARDIARFCGWCEAQGLELERITPFVVASYVEQGCPSANVSPADHLPLAHPSIKQHLSAIKMMFDHLVTGQIVVVNPAAAVRGPKHVVHRGKTPVLTGPEAKALLDSIATDKLTGFRDRALIATMVYSFARVSAVVGMDIEDYHPDGGGRTMWLRLHEKGGKHHEVPVHHQAEIYLDAYLDAAALRENQLRKTPLFRAVDRSGQLTTKRLDRRDVWAMIKRRAAAIGMSGEICCHTFRATGITAYLENGGIVEHAQKIAAHSSPRTTKLYDRTNDAVTLDEINRIDLSAIPKKRAM